MTDAQIISVSIVVLAVIAGVLVNNQRLNDVKELLWAEIKAESATLRAEMQRRFDSIDRKLDEVLRLLADRETRFQRLEQH